MSMKNYLITYNGAATRFKGTSFVQMASTPYDALFSYFSKFLDADFFPQDDGTILNCDRNHVADNGDSRFSYDGGYFVASELKEVISRAIEEDLIFPNFNEDTEGDVIAKIERITQKNIYFNEQKIEAAIETLRSRYETGGSAADMDSACEIARDEIASLFE